MVRLLLSIFRRSPPPPAIGATIIDPQAFDLALERAMPADAFDYTQYQNEG
jgi:hypothetical protein